MKDNQCVKLVRSEGMGSHYHQCHRQGVVRRDGKSYCKQHDPEAERQRRRERESTHREREKNQDGIHKEGEKLIKLLGTGSVYYNSFGKFSLHGYRRSLVVPFEIIEELIKLRSGIGGG